MKENRSFESPGRPAASGKPTVEMIPGGFTASSEYQVEYKYPSGIIHHCHSTPANNWMGGVVDKNGQQHGVKFEGTDGWVWVSRGVLQASNPELLVEPLP